MEFSRFKIIVKDKFEDIKNKTVLILGIGGVGSYAVEAIARCGVGKIIIADNDKVDITNINRQIISLHSTLMMDKVDVAEDRIKDINPDCEVVKINEYITEENVDLLFNEKIDYLVDACDTIPTKKAVIKECLKRKVKFISSMGTGNKLDPSKLEITDIRKTKYDPIAKIIRKMVKDEKINDKITVVCSSEEPIKNNSKIIGSCAFVPSTAGLLCASFIINDIMGSGTNERGTVKNN